MAITKRIKIRVRAGDTDFTGFAFNARVVEWFSAGRIELLRSKKITYANDGSLLVDGQPQKVSFVVGEVYARFHAPARFDDLVQLRTRIVDVSEKTLRFDYEIKRLPDRKLLVTGTSTSVCLSRETMRAEKIPADISERLRAGRWPPKDRGSLQKALI
ncbi:acyl-CoA thioesterase [Candidatus Bathyarchaeota archaeon]|nr:acyl-CoA thioesterase [Candidatus Bathyarchaeota archaeon]